MTKVYVCVSERDEQLLLISLKHPFVWLESCSCADNEWSAALFISGDFLSQTHTLATSQLFLSLFSYSHFLIEQHVLYCEKQLVFEQQQQQQQQAVSVCGARGAKANNAPAACGHELSTPTWNFTAASPLISSNFHLLWPLNKLCALRARVKQLFPITRPTTIVWQQPASCSLARLLSG